MLILHIHPHMLQRHHPAKDFRTQLPRSSFCLSLQELHHKDETVIVGENDLQVSWDPLPEERGSMVHRALPLEPWRGLIDRNLTDRRAQKESTVTLKRIFLDDDTPPGLLSCIIIARKVIPPPEMTLNNVLQEQERIAWTMTIDHDTSTVTIETGKYLVSNRNE
jgi:hypothetical protein